MKKLSLLFCVLFTCVFFNSNVQAEEPARTVDLGTQVTFQTVFYVDFINSTCIGYPAQFEKVTPTNTGRIYFKFASSEYIHPGQPFYYTMGEKLNNSTSPARSVAIKGTFKK